MLDDVRRSFRRGSAEVRAVDGISLEIAAGEFFNLIPTLTALDNVQAALAVGTLSRGDRPRRARELLESVGLADRTDHLPVNLSGGEQQRVAIARALANSPSVVLADEPTGNLDTATSNEIITLLEQLADNGVAVIVVTHADHVARRARRRLLMRDGRLSAAA